MTDLSFTHFVLDVLTPGISESCITMSQSSKGDDGKPTVPLLTVNDETDDIDDKEQQNREDSPRTPAVYNVAEHLLLGKDKSPCGVCMLYNF